MTKYLIGIDGGSQSSKIVIFDLDGNIIASGKQDLKPYHLEAGGIVEHPDDDLWESICVASKRAMAKFSGDKADIVGVGLGSIRFCRALLKKDGTLSQPVMSWMDRRVSVPYVHDNPDTAFVTTATGYITARVTGEFNDTAANYQGVWPIDTDTWQWLENEEEFAKYNLTRDMLFHLKMPGEKLGNVTAYASKMTGIPEGLPVFATANDKAVEALGSGIKGGSSALISLGTYIAAMVEGTHNPKNTKNFWTNFASEPNKYLYESNGIRRGMWTISWFKDILGESFVEYAQSQNKIPEEVLNEEALLVPAGSEGLLVVLDWLAPVDAPYKKGSMLGFDGRHTRAHIYRAIVEAIAMTMKNHVDAMSAELNNRIDKVIISGGGSSSDLFMQIFADVFNIPAQRNVMNGAAGLGAAINAAIGLGYYDSYEEAVDRMVQVDKVFKPIRDNASLYKKVNTNVYKGITEHTDKIYQTLYEIFQ